MWREQRNSLSAVLKLAPKLSQLTRWRGTLGALIPMLCCVLCSLGVAFSLFFFVFCFSFHDQTPSSISKLSDQFLGPTGDWIPNRFRRFRLHDQFLGPDWWLDSEQIFTISTPWSDQFLGPDWRFDSQQISTTSFGKCFPFFACVCYLRQALGIYASICLQLFLSVLPLTFKSIDIERNH